MIPYSARDYMQYPLVHTWAIIAAHKLPSGPDLRQMCLKYLGSLVFIEYMYLVLKDLNEPWFLQD